MQTTDAITFPSKRDTWLVIVIWLTVAMSAAGLVVPWLAPGPRGAALLTSILLSGAIVLALSVLYGTRYVVSAERITIRSGPFRWTVEIASIVSIRPTNDPTSSPACSLDRLEIACDGGRPPVMISPDDKERFLDEVAQRNARLVRHGANLEQRAS